MEVSRRTFMEGTALGLFGILPLQTINSLSQSYTKQEENKMNALYPTADPKDARAIVGASHTNFEAVQELVSAQPELAKASYDWGFGDWESALGAASHMGRKDIAEFLMENGARPNIYTFAMLGHVETVKALISEMPNSIKTPGPHGFNLMHHAMIRIRRKNVEGEELKRQESLVTFLETIPDANLKATAMEISVDEQKQYVGMYTFGTGEDEYFIVNVNSRNQLSIGRGEYNGRALFKQNAHSFAPGGAPSVRVNFNVENGKASTLTIHQSEPILTATKA